MSCGVVIFELGFTGSSVAQKCFSQSLKRDKAIKDTLYLQLGKYGVVLFESRINISPSMLSKAYRSYSKTICEQYRGFDVLDIDKVNRTIKTTTQVGRIGEVVSESSFFTTNCTTSLSRFESFLSSMVASGGLDEYTLKFLEHNVFFTLKLTHGIDVSGLARAMLDLLK